MRSLLMVVFAASIVICHTEARGFGELVYSAMGEKDDIEICAPVRYESLMLLISDGKSIMAVVFSGDVNNSNGGRRECGVKYSYRHYSKSNKIEQKRDGLLCERTKEVGKDGKNRLVLEDDGSQLELTAAAIKVKWSYGGPGRGWLYYNPEEVRVQIAHAKGFRTIDLARFIERSK
jgi:hypothetical protein